MNLPTSLLSDFAKATNDEAEKPKEYTAYGKVLSVNTQTGTYNVLLDGAENPIVCDSTTTAKQNDRVTVTIKNRQATVTGNATSKTINGDVLVNGNGTFKGRVEAESGYFKGELQAATGTFNGDLNAAGGTFKGSLSAATGTFSGDLNAASGTFKGRLTAATGSFSGAVKFTWPYGSMTEYVSIGDPNTDEPLYIYGDTINLGRVQTFVGAGYIELTQATGSKSADLTPTGVHTYSDLRLKDHIQPISPEIAKRLRPVKYRFKGSDDEQYGFIAQEVEKLMPGAVDEGRDGYLKLNYQELIAPLYALVQELQKEVDELRKEVKILGETKDNSVSIER